MDWFPTMELRTKIADVTQRLIDAYHAPGPKRGHAASLPPVDELVLTMLSQSTTDVNSWRGFTALRERFSSWDAVADAPVEEIEAAIRACGLSRQKAPRIQAVLQRLREEHGRITLDFLAQKPPDEALAYLMSFHGVGRKTASCVLLFSLDMPVMPVDTHILRVARRLGLIPDEATADQAHDLLEALLPEEAYYVFHVNTITHGRQTCTARNPACPRCPVLELCPYAGFGAWGKRAGNPE
ncbi:MAG: endonuclease III domain-containing protein [Armatimonadota bacterium]